MVGLIFTSAFACNYSVCLILESAFRF